MIALIGAGPLGIEMAVALKRAGIPYVHFEAGQVGATMAWWAPGTRWFSSNERIAIAGVPLVTVAQEKATREEYLAYLRGVVQQFTLEIRTYTAVSSIDRQENGFTLWYSPTRISDDDKPDADETIHVDKIILATGGTATPNLIDVPGEHMNHVSHYQREPHAYFQKRLLIVGGRNSAVEAAMRAYRVGAEVHFSYHGPAVDAKDIKYWLYPEFSSLVKAGKIHGHFGTRVTRIGSAHVTLANAEGEPAPRDVPVDFVLLMTGYRADMSLAAMAGVELAGERQVPVFNPTTMESNVPGVYIAGTAVAGTQGRYKVFLENCHVHVERIVAHLTGKTPPAEAAAFERPES